MILVNILSFSACLAILSAVRIDDFGNIIEPPCDNEKNNIYYQPDPSGELDVFNGKEFWRINKGRTLYRGYVNKTLPVTEIKAFYQRPNHEFAIVDQDLNLHRYREGKIIETMEVSDFVNASTKVHKINALFSTHSGRSYVIYNSNNIKEIDECTFKTKDCDSKDKLVTWLRSKNVSYNGHFPDVISVFKYNKNGLLYFIVEGGINGWVLTFNEFDFELADMTNFITTPKHITSRLLGICPEVDKDIMYNINSYINKWMVCKPRWSTFVNLDGL